MRSIWRMSSTCVRTLSHSFSTWRAEKRICISSFCDLLLQLDVLRRLVAFLRAARRASARRCLRIVAKCASAATLSRSRFSAGDRAGVAFVLARPRRSSSTSSIASSCLVEVHEAVDQVVDLELVLLDLGRRGRGSARPSSGRREIARIMCFRPSSMRLAISISPSRVSSSTEPISRMYMRTGSVVRPNSESSVDTAASASSSTSSAGTVARRLRHQQRFGVGGLVVDLDAHVVDHQMMPSICSASSRSSGRWSLISAYVRKPRSLPSTISVFRRRLRASTSAGVSSRGAISACRPLLPFLLRGVFARACRRSSRRSRPRSACARGAAAALRARALGRRGGLAGVRPRLPVDGLAGALACGLRLGDDFGGGLADGLGAGFGARRRLALRLRCRLAGATFFGRGFAGALFFLAVARRSCDRLRGDAPSASPTAFFELARLRARPLLRRRLAGLGFGGRLAGGLRGLLGHGHP